MCVCMCHTQTQVIWVKGGGRSGQEEAMLSERMAQQLYAVELLSISIMFPLMLE